jgi:hypothetical protein
MRKLNHWTAPRPRASRKRGRRRSSLRSPRRTLRKSARSCAISPPPAERRNNHKLRRSPHATIDCLKVGVQVKRVVRDMSQAETLRPAGAPFLGDGRSARPGMGGAEPRSRAGGGPVRERASRGGRLPDQPKRMRAPSSGTPASFVVHSSPAAIGKARVRVPVVTISPAARGGLSGSCASVSTR